MSASRLAAATALGLTFIAGGATATLVNGHDPDRIVAEAASRIAAQAAQPITRQQLDAAAVQGMLAALDDRWATYFTPNQFATFQNALNGAYSGVGIWVGRDRGGLLTVISVGAGSPAALDGVRRGDVLIAVAGRAVAGQSIATVVEWLRGAPGSSVSLVLERGTTTYRRTFVRAAVGDDDVSARPLGAGIVLLRIAAFTGGVGRWVRSEVVALDAAHATGIVLDLRGNPGGLLSEAVQSASAFLDGGPVVSFIRPRQSPLVVTAVGRGDVRTPLVVLVDGGTASAAEVVAGALQDRGRAVIVGSRTFGKGSVQEPTRLADGSGFELTVGTYLTPDGRAVDGVGIAPDVSVLPGSPPQVAEQRAVEVLSGMVADSGASAGG